MVSAVIVAAGSGSRMGAGFNKVFLPLGECTVLETTLGVFSSCPEIDEIILVTGAGDIERCKAFQSQYRIARIVAGGNTRPESVANGVRAASGSYVAIHDAARPLITTELIKEAVLQAKQHKAAAVGVICKDTLKQLDADGFFRTTLNRETTIQIQTPQVFEKKLLEQAYRSYPDFCPTDECAYMEQMGVAVKLVPGSYENIKLTTPEDVAVAEQILRKRGEQQ